MAYGQDHSMYLEWIPNPIDLHLVQYFILYRKSGGDWKRVAEVPYLDAPYHYTDGGLTNGKVYYYVVRSANSLFCPICNPTMLWPVEHTGPASNVASDTTIGEPSSPQNVQGMYSETGAWWTPGPVVVLSWNRPADDGGKIDDYRIYRGTSSGQEIYHGTVPGDQLVFGDLDLASNQYLYYVVYAHNSRGRGLPSEEVRVWVPTPPEPPPPPVADLVRSDPTIVGPLRCVESSTVNIQLWFRNVGNEDAGPFYYILYLSVDTVIAPSDLPFYSGSVSGVGANSSITFTVNAVLPSGITGSYHYGLAMDTSNAISELDENNNWGWSDECVIISPLYSDLAASLLELPSSIVAGSPLLVHVSFSMSSAATTGVTCKFCIVPSLDNVIPSSEFGNMATISLLPGQTYDHWIEIVAAPWSTAPGSYYFGVMIDSIDEIVETYEANNIFVTPQTSEVTSSPSRNLEAVSVEGPSRCSENESVVFHISIRNPGINPVTQFRYEIRLLKEVNGKLRNVTVLHFVDKLVTIAPGSTYEENVSVVIPQAMIGKTLIRFPDSHYLVESPFHYGLYVQWAGSVYGPGYWGNDSFAWSLEEATIDASAEPLPLGARGPPSDLTIQFSCRFNYSDCIPSYFVCLSWKSPIDWNPFDPEDVNGHSCRLYREALGGQKTEIPFWEISGNSAGGYCYQYSEELAPGQTYAFYITTVVEDDIGVEGPPSNLAVVAVPDLPSAPLSLVVAPEAGMMHLEWSPPLTDGGMPVLGYHIFRGSENKNMELIDVVSSQLSYDDSGILPDTTYFYRVSAVNHLMDGDLSVAAGRFVLSLTTGWNLVTVPSIGYGYKASTLGLNSGDRVAAWDPATQTYKTHVVGLPLDDFVIAPSTGYWIYVGSGTRTLSLFGVILDVTQTRNITVPAGGGWAIIGLNSLTSAWKVEDLKNMYAGAGLTMVVKWNAAPQSFVVHMVGLPVNNFNLVPGQAYWIYCSASGTLSYSP